MPTIHFTCETCGWGYTMLVFEDDTPKPLCPECKSAQAIPLPKPTSLFKGITHFSTLAKDTN